MLIVTTNLAVLGSVEQHLAQGSAREASGLMHALASTRYDFSFFSTDILNCAHFKPTYPHISVASESADKRKRLALNILRAKIRLESCLS